MRVRIISIKDAAGANREDKFYTSMLGKFGEVQKLAKGEKMAIRLDKERGEDHVYLKTSTVNEIIQKKKLHTVRTTNSTYQLEVVEE